MSLGLTAKTTPQRMIVEYLERTASEVLREKIKNGNKTMDGCWQFIMKEAEKLAIGNSACIEEQVVYGWAVHYFEEEGIQESTRGHVCEEKTEKVEITAEEKKEACEAKYEATQEKVVRDRHGNPKKQEKKKDEPSLNQMTIFDFWSENNG